MPDCAPVRRILKLSSALVVAALLPGTASAQSLNLRDLLPDFLRQGISLAPPSVGTDHSAHFIGDESPQFRALQQLNLEIAYQLSTFPLASSAGGFAYELDPALGVFNRPTKSFGPIYTERAFNVGKGKINLGFNYSYQTFDKIDDINLRDGDMKLVFGHEDSNHDGTHLTSFFEGDVITSRVYMNISASTTALVATYGVSDRFDFGMAIPVVSVDMDVSAEAEVNRLSTGDNLSDTHVFINGTPRETIRQGGSASGLGDVVLRGKYRATGNQAGVLAFLGEVRLPTGDERNLLGTGAALGKLSLVGTLNRDFLAPHFNVGYGVSGNDLPSELTYSAGFDWTVDPRITISAEVLGRSQTDVRSVAVEDSVFSANTAPTGDPVIITATLPRLTYATGESRNTLTGAVGFKINFTGNFLLSANGQFPLTKKGLRDDFASLVGIDYSF